jgi:tetratricopeptide (TPR) repeat protein
MCVDEESAQDVYVFMGNCYRELGYADSAIMFYDEGLTLIPDNRYLWDNKLFTLKTMGDDEAVIACKATMLERFPDDMELAEELVDDYLVWERWDDVIRLADQILDVNPGNANVSNMKRQAIEALGGDPIDFVRENYEKNPGNVPNAQEYAGLLRERGETTSAIAVLEGILKVSPGLSRVMKDLVEAYKETGQNRDLINTLMKLNGMDPGDIRLYFDITEAYIADGQFKSAMSWAEKAINLDSKSGQAYANRGAVYEAVANACTGATADFSDKLVFMMAYEDYLSAKQNGYAKANSKVDFLAEARIPQKGDWFFNKDDYVVKGKAAPKKECYNWLNRTVTAPKD